MNILFLDIDGVLNSNRTILTTDVEGKSYLDVFRDGIDPVAVKMINKLCEKHYLQIVLVSNQRWDFLQVTEMDAILSVWIRHIPDLLGIAKRLRDYGIEGRYLLDATPEILSPGARRDDEIRHWLFLHPAEKFVIIDDINNYRPDLLPFLVHVDSKEGFSFKNYQEAETILGGTPTPDKMKIKLPPK